MDLAWGRADFVPVHRDTHFLYSRRRRGMTMYELYHPQKRFQKQVCRLVNSQGIISGCFGVPKVLKEASERIRVL